MRVSVVGNFNHWDGRRHPMRNCGHDRDLGDLHPRPLAGRGLQVRDQEPASAATSSRSPTPTASPPSCGPRPPRSSGTSTVRAGTTTNGWRTARRRQALDAPDRRSTRCHLGSWRRKVEEGNRFLTYRELADQLVEYLKETGLHPRRADADQRAPVRRQLGLSAGRLLRPDVAVRHARTTSPTSSTRCTATASA